MRFAPPLISGGLFLAALAVSTTAFAQQAAIAQQYESEIKPLLQKYCFDCHGNGQAEGGKAFDKMEIDGTLLTDNKLWLTALANVRASVMPPEGHPRPDAEEVKKLGDWIKFSVFKIDPAQADPGRVVLRRLNRTEYENTIRDLLGYEFNAKEAFPPDDTGYGFDTIGEVLMISPLLMEKYLNAAETIVDANIPKVSREVGQQVLTARDFQLVEFDPPGLVLPPTNPPEGMPAPNAAPAAGDNAQAAGDAPAANPNAANPPAANADGQNPPPANPNPNAENANPNDPAAARGRGRGRGQGRGAGRQGRQGRGPQRVQSPLERRAAAIGRGGPARVDFADPPFPVAMTGSVDVAVAGRYVIDLEVWLRGSFDVDPGRVTTKLFVNGQEQYSDVYGWEERTSKYYKFEFDWQPGKQDLRFELTPLPPGEISGGRRANSRATFEVGAMKILGPLDPALWVKPQGYEKYFTRDFPPLASPEREEYAREVLRPFATRAFRRPVDDDTLNRLVDTAKSVYSQPDKTFEEGISRAMVAVLASPRFLYRVETSLPKAGEDKYALIDEYALASRLSYFLWSSPPDDELLKLASENRLRENLDAQIDRLLGDERIQNFLSGFVGQWLRSRELDSVLIEAEAIVNADESPEDRAARLENEERSRGRMNIQTNARSYVFGANLRTAMRQETEMTVGYILENNRSLLELLDSNYTFLNGPLATHYGIDDVQGNQMQYVELPEGSIRGGILTQGTLLTVTSNPTRTSPVKRGLYVLEYLLGTPPAAPPPNIPELEDSIDKFAGRTPALREVLQVHRENPLCTSCHGRMDPLGLALENFNAMGMYRDKDAQQPIDPSGKLITGEEFKDIRELKKILVGTRRRDFYHCLTEKLLTYAVGRGVEYYDTQTIDEIVEELDARQGESRALIKGIIHSAPFQRRRDPELVAAVEE